MMNVWKISIDNIKHKPLNFVLSVLFLAVGFALLLGVEELNMSFKSQFNKGLSGVDLVVGAKGSPLQLVMASLLQIDNPIGNISYQEAEKIGRNRLIEKAVPISYGDNYNGFRVVGTTDAYASLFHGEIVEGRKPIKPFEVAVGNAIAKKELLKVGDTFKSSHGVVTGGHLHDKDLVVTGVYQATETVLDRLVITPLESVWEMHHHEEKGEIHHEHKHEDKNEHIEKEITALLVVFRSPTGLLTIPRKINETTNMQAALPKYELEKLYNYTGVGVTIISYIAYLILSLSCFTLLLSLFKMISERVFDLALLRTYGAKTSELLKMVFYEGIILITIAITLGTLISQIIVLLVTMILKDDYLQGLSFDMPYLQFFKIVFLLLGVLFIAVLVSIIPLSKIKISKVLNHEL
ncbi:ABC transporter permease [Neptunitalea lumnitzerae]|uniref:Peptide ABC transporter permease n=1 Tax=Neptunitalea lumnitzerae TaxID=2965509 RepID=A0ABQ5ML79_9FLAO|nr:FtsX-like permease family protein [Neptunitalea sp. Y10]GLB49820.1 peptide ABC transporter permease [Neptunitalea sp. Y10]